MLVHYLPIEHYPPVLNFINYFSKGNDLTTITTQVEGQDRFLSSSQIIRTKKPKYVRLNIIYYIIFYLKTFFEIIKSRPSVIVYYESFNALVPILYKIFINKNVKICVHYHEYVSRHEYDSGMKITRFIHDYIEKKNFTKIDWISQTNISRANFFEIDNNLKSNTVNIFPNYPPKSWSMINKKFDSKFIKMVYIGYGLNSRGNYIVEFLEAIKKLDKYIQIDLYLINNEDVNNLVDLYNNEKIKIILNGSISYFDLPKVLSKYEYGLILYKPTSPNWVYNAPNKFFEYLVFNLIIIYPLEMKAITDYVDEYKIENVIKIDFNDKNLKIDLFKNRDSNIENNPFFCEKVFKKFENSILI